MINKKKSNYKKKKKYNNKLNSIPFKKKQLYQKKFKKILKLLLKKNKDPLNFSKYHQYLKNIVTDSIRLRTRTSYLHSNLKTKKGVFLRKPFFDDIKYPFSLNLNLINEYIKKK